MQRTKFSFVAAIPMGRRGAKDAPTRRPADAELISPLTVLTGTLLGVLAVTGLVVYFALSSI
jgi:hypothetical protein